MVNKANLGVDYHFKKWTSQVQPEMFAPFAYEGEKALEISKNAAGL